MRVENVGNTRKLRWDLNGIDYKGSAFCTSPFLVPADGVSAFTEKMHTYTSPRQGSLIKLALSSELDKILSRNISGILKIKRGDALCSA